MSDFDGSTNWDLHAIVKAQTTNVATTAITPSNNSYAYWFESLVLEDHKGESSYSTMFNELEELCKPFRRNIIDQGSSSLDCNPRILDSALTSKLEHDHDDDNEHKMMSSDVENREQKLKTTKRASTQVKRRNKHKKISLVSHAMGGDHLMLDRWNWRKYGEKSIKGSRFPRSYYKCSSSKGCSARKQVDQNNANPEEFLITYMGEHNHPYPTRRHSQAGHNVRRFKPQTPTQSTSDTSTNSEQQDLTKLTKEQQDDYKYDDTFEMVGQSQERSSVDNIGTINNMEWQDDDVFAGLDCLQGLEMSGYISDQIFSFDPFSHNVHP